MLIKWSYKFPQLRWLLSLEWSSYLAVCYHVNGMWEYRKPIASVTLKKCQYIIWQISTCEQFSEGFRTPWSVGLNREPVSNPSFFQAYFSFFNLPAELIHLPAAIHVGICTLWHLQRKNEITLLLLRIGWDHIFNQHKMLYWKICSIPYYLPAMHNRSRLIKCRWTNTTILPVLKFLKRQSSLDRRLGISNSPTNHST